MTIHIHPVVIPPRFYKPIGRIAAGWNLTEALVSSIIWYLHGIRDPKKGRLFTYRPGATEKLKILSVTINKYARPIVKNQLKPLLSRASEMKAMRNKIIHDLWGRMPKEPKIWKVFYQRDTDDMVLLRRDVMTVDTVKRIADQLDQLNRDLKKWMAKNRVPPP